jgi:hypothetical protein
MAIDIGNLSVHMVTDDSELYAIWPKISDGINLVKKRCKGVFYRPEDVYHAIKSNQAQLLVGVIANQYQGFAVIKSADYPDGKGLHIWVMHNCGTDKQFVDNFFEAIAEIARLSNVIRVSYSSSREGWGKRSEKCGYKRTASVHYFEKEI